MHWISNAFCDSFTNSEDPSWATEDRRRRGSRPAPYSLSIIMANISSLSLPTHRPEGGDEGRADPSRPSPTPTHLRATACQRRRCSLAWVVAVGEVGNAPEAAVPAPCWGLNRSFFYQSNHPWALSVACATHTAPGDRCGISSDSIPHLLEAVLGAGLIPGSGGSDGEPPPSLRMDRVRKHHRPRRSACERSGGRYSCSRYLGLATFLSILRLSYAGHRPTRGAAEFNGRSPWGVVATVLLRHPS